MGVYNLSGKQIANENLDYDYTVKSINHRGYNIVAPENTLPAYILSKKMGFNYVETDIAFTSDGVPMLLHDSTIDRTSNGSGTLSQMTYSQVRQYDFGSWKSPEYAGTVIPTLAEFLDLCKSIMLHPYLELKTNGGYTQAQIEQIVDLVNTYGMRGKVSYISFSSAYLGYVKSYDANARLGFINSPSVSDVSVCNGLKTQSNDVFYDANYTGITQNICDVFMSEDVPIEVWTVNTESGILALNKYISGVTSDSMIAGKVMYEHGIE